MRVASLLRQARRRLAAPLTRYFDSRFEQVAADLDRISKQVSATPDALTRVDVSEHNRGLTPPTFDRLVSQVVSASQFAHADFERLRRVMYPGVVVLPWGSSPGTAAHRKVWEFVYVLGAAEQEAVLEPGRRALGFGVGREPLPAALAKHGLSVVATDLGEEESETAAWAATQQHMSDLRALSHPAIVSDEALAEHVTVRHIDMNRIPDDLGTFDLVWSCCALEHLGSPRRGLDFVVRTLDLLEPGGVSVHTTELELTPREETADYGHLAVYRTIDLDELASRARALGFDMETNWYVSLDTPIDRWIAAHPYDDPAHLKLTIGESVSTSVGLLIRKPKQAAA